MKEKGILIRADYGHIALHLREIMEERDITRNQLAKRIDARFEVVNKWYQGELEKMDLDILARICYALDCTTEDSPRFSIYIKLDDRMFYLIS